MRPTRRSYCGDISHRVSYWIIGQYLFAHYCGDPFWPSEKSDFWDSMEAMAGSSWVARAMRHKLGADTEQKVYFRIVGGLS